MWISKLDFLNNHADFFWKRIEYLEYKYITIFPHHIKSVTTQCLASEKDKDECVKCVGFVGESVGKTRTVNFTRDHYIENRPWDGWMKWVIICSKIMRIENETKKCVIKHMKICIYFHYSKSSLHIFCILP
jgi:hypothetical protein